MKKPNGATEALLRDEVSGLRDKITELTARLQLLEGHDGDGNSVVKLNSRRDLLKLAGALAAGAAGGVMLRPISAGATAGNPVVLGALATAGNNDSTTTTHLGPPLPPSVTTPSPLVQIEGQGLPAIPPNPNAHSHQGGIPGVDKPISMPLLLVVAPYGVFPTGPVYPGFAPLLGIGGPVNDATTGLHIAEGVEGFAAVDLTDKDAGGNIISRGAGVVGESDNDIGVVGSGSTDLAAFGAGYIAQASITDVTGTTKIAGPPPSPVYDFEQARDKDSILWLSNPITADTAWRRVNSVIPITPVRVIETRSNVPGGVIGGIGGPLAANSNHTWTIRGNFGIPNTAIAIMGNLTSITPQNDGFMTIYPGPPATVPQATSLNYTRGISAICNQVIVGFNSGGQIQIFVSGNGFTQCVLDLTAYLV